MRPLYVVAAILAVLVAAYYGCWLWASGRPTLSPAVLAERALAAPTEDERQRATVDLAGMGSAGLADLRRLLQQSKDPAVRASSAQALGDLRDYESIDLLMQFLDDETPLVRARAQTALSHLLRRDLHFPVEGSASERSQAAAGVRKTWEQIRMLSLLEPIKAGKALTYFYDRNTGQLFEGLSEAEGLIEAPSGPYRGRPAGARASVFACRAGDKSEQRFVGYLMVPEDIVRKHGENIVGRPAAGGGPAAAIVLCRPGEDRWVYVDSPEGQAIKAEVLRRCQGKGELRACFPDG
jgi:hypothetical protein